MNSITERDLRSSQVSLFSKRFGEISERIVYTKGQEESLVIGTDLLYDLLEKVNQHKYTIILTHYPFDALKAEEKTQVCRILEQFGVQIWMSGHLHDVLVQQHRKAFYEFQCGNLLTDGGIPNILIGQLDIESGEGERGTSEQ